MKKTISIYLILGLRKIDRIILPLLLLTGSVYGNQASFDCSKVEKQSSEGIICASDVLMDLDRKLATVYKKALSKASKDDRLKANQRGWIKGRNACWKAEDEVTCMQEQYLMRMDELKNKYSLSGTSEASVKGFDKVLKLQGITFHVKASNAGSLNQLSISTTGLELGDEVIKKEIDGSVTGAEIADINGDGSPEIYVYVSSAGSGAYGSLVAYSANHKKSISEIYLAPLEEDKKNSVGYMGHDVFTVIESTLARRFPVYKKEDANCCPKGGTRQLAYKLLPGEAGWLLKLHKSRTE